MIWQILLKLGKTAGIVFAVLLVYTLYEAFAPPTSGPGLMPWDKAVHFTAFFVLTGVALVAFPRQPLWRIAAGMSVIGALIELIQALPFVNRDCDVWDWVAEMVAIAALYGTILAARLRRSLGEDGERKVETKQAAE